jgi:hypothetical protein
MAYDNINWNPTQARLRELIKKKENFDEMKELLLQMHALLHCREVYEGTEPTYMDELWEDLGDTAFRTMPTIKDDTIAWNIWHITRIEDLTANYLIAGCEQVLEETWLRKLNTRVTDTGNAMTDEEIISFSNEVDKDALYQYRNEVGRRVKGILEGLQFEDLKRKVPQKGIQRIAELGGVSPHPDAVWLLGFWGRKNVAGILLMPITRHQVVHINDSRRLREVCKKIKQSK